MENRDSGVEDLPDDLTLLEQLRTMLGQVHLVISGNAITVQIAVFQPSLRSRPSNFQSIIIRSKSAGKSGDIGILKILRHDNIVPLLGTVTGFERMPQSRCLVTPWIPNGTLNAYLASNHSDLTELDRSRMLQDV
ncbi:uncharacterized protein BJ212DRAFT_599381 [Suillus subaureus]|uniref:Serine-threonine/tyrosine-protein kinase catalytic domain-containing protein n=1 Tax=Suillus subaureus TaxID=48587 RepID=A0A9P7E2P0_9AGAM|nr:uncharacterized protein BJ212DRAFT_599381 [Suillus subaureus]KAG1809710.1 hypothetical protein BJ212DRAFT_599381 [Suillus subaureus]